MDSSFPGSTWHRAENVKSLGWSVKGLKDAEIYAQSIGSNALMLVQHGLVVCQWGDVSRKSSMASVRKSFISALIGIAVARGKLSLEQTLDDLGINDRGTLTATEKLATLSDIMQCRSGIYHPSVYDTQLGRPERGAYGPGEHWFYNNWDFNVVGSILRKSASMDWAHSIETTIAQPLQMQDFSSQDCFLLAGEESIHPVYKLRMSCRDLTRFGLLYQQTGKWNQQQLIAEDWVRKSTCAHTTDVSHYTPFIKHPGRGYGHMWWTATAKGFCQGINLRYPCYYASGYGGQYLVVIPDKNLVIAHTVKQVDDGISHQKMALLLQMIMAAVS